MLESRWGVVIRAVAAGSLASTLGCGDDGGEDDGPGGRSAIEGDRVVQGAGAATGTAGAGGNGGVSNGGSGASTGALSCESLSAQVQAEELPAQEASLAGIAFTGDVRAFVDAALARRYPFGLELVRGGRLETTFGDCSVIFAGEPGSAAEVYESLEVIVHECGHMYDAVLSTGARDAYELSPELSFRCERGDTTTRGGDTFARSRIAGDDYAALRPACGGGSRADCDPYADVYLDGDPDDEIFDSGDQGFNLLLEESVQYVHSIATAWAFVDQQPAGISVSARDGILTFLWYIERYLRMARTEFPDAYERISQDDCWRDLTLGVWARAQRFLQLSSNVRALGIADDVLLDLVRQPELLGEIERLRALDDCP